MMHDPTFHYRTIADRLDAFDFATHASLSDPEHREAVIRDAINQGQNGFKPLSLKSSRIRERTVYQITDLSQNLVARHINLSLFKLTDAKQDDRGFIISCLKQLLEEGVPFDLFKFDIKNFYESIHPPRVLNRLVSDIDFSGQSVRALGSLFQRLSQHGVIGLPRGLSISATLSEYFLKEFDNELKNYSGVYFYVRFVDDILIICDHRIDAPSFKKHVLSILPEGLAFNNKSRYMRFSPFARGSTDGDIEHVFTYLGYKFSVSKIFRSTSGHARSVCVDIAPNKIQKIKTRIVKSFIQYNFDRNYMDLLSRIKLLTSNYNIKDRRSGNSKSSGIYFNYPLISPIPSANIDSLDRFLRNLVWSSHRRNRAKPTLTLDQRHELSRLTFRSGFETKRFFAFRPERLTHLTRCWKYA